MTTTAPAPAAADWRLDLPPSRWHRPLLVLGILLAGLTIATLVGWLVDDRELLGVNLWEKPLKFAISGTIYAVTWAWIIGHFTRWQRAAWWAGTVIAVTLAIELVVIVGAAAAGITSHFNVSTPLATTLWSIMAAAITTLWVATFVAAVALWRNPGADPARQAAIRTGVAISLLGMGLAFLMTGPTPSSSTTSRASRVPTRSALPTAAPACLCSGGARSAATCAFRTSSACTPCRPCRCSRCCSSSVRAGCPCCAMHWCVEASFSPARAPTSASSGWSRCRPLRGQSIVRPDALTLSIGIAIAALALAASLGVLAAGSRRQRLASL